MCIYFKCLLTCVAEKLTLVTKSQFSLIFLKTVITWLKFSFKIYNRSSIWQGMLKYKFKYYLPQKTYYTVGEHERGKQLFWFSTTQMCQNMNVCFSKKTNEFIINWDIRRSWRIYPRWKQRRGWNDFLRVVWYWGSYEAIAEDISFISRGPCDHQILHLNWLWCTLELNW